MHGWYPILPPTLDSAFLSSHSSLTYIVVEILNQQIACGQLIESWFYPQKIRDPYLPKVGPLIFSLGRSIR